MNTCNNTTSPTNLIIRDNIKKIHEKLADCMLQRSIFVNKVHKQDNIANSAIDNSKKAHKKLFKNVLKKITSVNNVFITDECKKLHKKLFNNVLKELLSKNLSAGYKDASATVKDGAINDVNMHYTHTKLSKEAYMHIKSFDLQHEIDNTTDNLLLSDNNICISFEDMLLNNFKKI